ncbi:MAG: hypothetical protein K2P81_12970 [Bacteriovoracaceae bacterium]|nr:hypothetical protein [Bacteriovoracaceae bacterium]
MKYLLLLVLLSCGKNTSYVYNNKQISSAVTRESHTVVGDGGQVDILWVIDNSGSMSDIQQDVIANADKFMQEFLKNNSLDWKMGLLSTSEDEQPYLGFATLFDRKDKDPVATFGAAVSRLGTSGSGTEKDFKPVMDKLNQYKSFLRPSAYLILVFVTDEFEQSDITAQNFMADMVAKKSGRAQMIRAYGAFHAKDFGCSGTYDQLVYAGSVFEEVINATNGKAYSTCTPDFGIQLASLGNDIVAAISSPVILLSKRPLVSTLKVLYKGAELPAGPQSAGGLWIYDPDANGVRFHNMDFVDFNVKAVEIEFQVDQGQ